MHFRHISAKIQPKSLKLVHYYFFSLRDSIGSPGYALVIMQQQQLNSSKSVTVADLCVVGMSYLPGPLEEAVTAYS